MCARNVQFQSASATRRAALASSLLCFAMLAGSAFGQSAPKLMAPLYPGAVSRVTEGGKAVPCVSDKTWKFSTWCYVTNDPIDKVKAFYDQKVAPLEAIPGVVLGGRGDDGKWKPARSKGYWLRMQYIDSGEADEDHFGGVKVIARLPATVPAGDSTALRDITMASPHFKPLAEQVAWEGGGVNEMMAKAMGRTSHPLSELESLFTKNASLESMYFRAEVKDKKRVYAYEPLQRDMQAKAAQGAQQAQGRADAAPDEITKRNMARPSRNPSGDQDDKELNDLFQRKPALGNAYAAKAMQANEFIQKGQYREAAQAGKEGEQLVRNDPEGAAILKRRDERAAQRKAAGQKERAADEDRMKQDRAAVDKQQEYQRWGVWVDYLAAAQKLEHYATVIYLDEQSPNGNQKPAEIDKAWKNWMSRHGKDDQEDADGTPAKAQAASKPDAAKPEAKKDEPKKDSGDGAADTAKKAGEEGLKMLKKLF